MSSVKRPIGVTILASFFFFLGIWQAFALGKAQSLSNINLQFLLLNIFCVILFAACSIGLKEMKAWGRLLVIGTMVLYIIFGFYTFILGYTRYHPRDLLSILNADSSHWLGLIVSLTTILIIPIASIWYLNKASVKNQFK